MAELEIISGIAAQSTISSVELQALLADLLAGYNVTFEVIE
jgi:hypothetical protein